MNNPEQQAKEALLPSGKSALRPYFLRIYVAVAETLIPEGGKLGVSFTQTSAVRFFTRYLKDQDPGARAGQLALLAIFDLLPFLFIGRFSRFVNLSPEEKELYMMDWYASRIYYRRMVVVLLKTLAGMGYYNDPKVLKALDFELPCPEGGSR